jgi:hypothetical protein
LRSFARIVQLSTVVPMIIAVASVFIVLTWGIFGIGRKLGWVAAPPPNYGWNGRDR